MQSKLSIALNNILRYIVIYCIVFIWINYYYPKFLPSVIISIIITSIVVILISKIIYKKRDKEKITADTETKIRNIMLSLITLNDTELIDYFYLVLTSQYGQITKTDKYLIYKNTLIYPIFKPELLVQDYLDIIKDNHNKKTVILTKKVSTELSNFLSLLEKTTIKILTESDVYKYIIEPSNISIVEKIHYKQPAKLKINQLLHFAFNKKNAKNYIGSGIILMLTSFLYGYSIYYQIVATILFCFALFSVSNKKYNTDNNQNIFE